MQEEKSLFASLLEEEIKKLVELELLYEEKENEIINRILGNYGKEEKMETNLPSSSNSELSIIPEQRK